MINAMNVLNEFYVLDYDTNQITSKCNAELRTKILTNFATNNKIQLLFSCRILDECIDIPTCDSIYITYPSKSKIRTIQRLCRCIRINKYNKFKIGNIYIWCDMYDDILETLSGIKEYDLFFKDKILVNQTNYFGKSECIEFNSDVKLIEKYIVGIKEFKQLSWNDKLKLVEDYMIEHNKKPSKSDKNKDIKILWKWIQHQTENHKKIQYNMKNNMIKQSWELFTSKYKQYFLSNEEVWNMNLMLVEKYIIENKKKPSQYDKNVNIKYLGLWLTTNIIRYKNNQRIMKNENIRKTWLLFITKYDKYFISTDEIWDYNLSLIEEYIIKNKKIPNRTDPDEDIKKLALWIEQRRYEYKNNIMKNEQKRNIFKIFIEKHNNYFLNRTNIWNYNLKLVEEYIIKNKKIPSQIDKNNEIKKLGCWINQIKQHYRNNKNIMKDENIKKTWIQFIKKYDNYF
jgi:hypothetical protein